MLKLFSAFRKEKIWDFDGGIHPPEMKTQSSGTPLRQIPHVRYRNGDCSAHGSPPFCPV